MQTFVVFALTLKRNAVRQWPNGQLLKNAVCAFKNSMLQNEQYSFPDEDYLAAATHT